MVDRFEIDALTELGPIPNREAPNYREAVEASIREVEDDLVSDADREGD
jgi:hypothetical protein